MRSKMNLAVLAASLVLLASGQASAKDDQSRVPEEFLSAPAGRRPTTRNPEGTWRGRVVRLTAYPAAEAPRFEIVISSAVDDSPAPGQKLTQVTVYTDLLPNLRPNDWVIFRGRQFCIRPDQATGKLEWGHLSGVWEVALDERDAAGIQEAVRLARPFSRAPGAPECSRTPQGEFFR
ncbi:MAG: hypothetical protein FD126_1645 [Elusimicrobia bacterium]|nr:MAG: hypothetical protein FD126_1645 [Elusimicrobiota bacterium]